MVKAYLRYEPSSAFGLVSSFLSNAVVDHTAELVVAPALEDVLVWNLRQGAQVCRYV